MNGEQKERRPQYVCPHFRPALRVVGFEAFGFFGFPPFLSNQLLDCMAS